MNALPLEIDHERDECFLRLPGSLSNIIITPPRLSDAQAAAEVLNEPAIYPFTGACYPHTAEDATKFINTVKPTCDIAWEEIKSGSVKNGFYTTCPVRSLRVIGKDGTQEYIGDIGLIRSTSLEVINIEERQRLKAENLSKHPGDPTIIWSTGYYLKPSYQRRGIMSAALRTLIIEWGAPFMGIRHMKANSRADNQGSTKVLIKTGFEPVGIIEKALRLEDSKGGGVYDLRIYEYKIDLS